MKSRHAAAVALVSWYLVLPLQAPDEQGTADAAPSPAASSPLRSTNPRRIARRSVANSLMIRS